MHEFTTLFNTNRTHYLWDYSSTALMSTRETSKHSFCTTVHATLCQKKSFMQQVTALSSILSSLKIPWKVLGFAIKPRLVFEDIQHGTTPLYKFHAVVCHQFIQNRVSKDKLDMILEGYSICCVSKGKANKVL